MPPAHQPSHTRLRRAAFAACYVVAAWPALACELGWHRLLVPVLGTTTAATSLLLAAYMFGLGAGSLAASRLLSGRGRFPVVLFALAHLLGAGALWLPALGGGVVFSVAGVAAATLLLGATFPLAAAVRAADGSGRGAEAGILYALDTAAGLLGCLVALLLVPWRGIANLLALGSLMKLAGAAVALLLYYQTLPGRQRGASAPASTPVAGRPGPVYLLVAMCGFVLLGAETIWSRLLAFVLFRGSTVYAMAALLAVVLGAASAGAGLGARLSRRDQARLWVVRACLGCAGALLWSLGVLLVAGPTPTRSALGISDLLWAVLACAPAAFLSALAFAAACRQLGGAAAAGRLLAANTSGAVAGALLVPLLAVPGLGLSASLVCEAMLLALAAVLVEARLRRRRRLAALAVLIAAGLSLQAAGPRWVRHLGQALYYREGRQASVAVVELGRGLRRLYVDAMAVAGNDLAMLTDQFTLAHLPLLLHPRARRVLTVGFGSGSTSWAFLAHPGLLVDCVEISGAVVGAAEWFSRINGGLPKKAPPGYRLIMQDARTYLRKTEVRYDVIVNDCTDLAYRSDAALYTRQFFALVRSRLAAGGLAAAWVPLRGQQPFRSLRSVLGAFTEVFPSTSLWVFDSTPLHFGILVGGAEPRRVSLAAAERLLANERVRRQLQRVGLDDPARLAVSRHFDDTTLRYLAVGLPANSDDRPVVEYWAPLEEGGDASAYRFIRLAPSSPPPALDEALPDMLAAVARRVAQRPWLLAGNRALAAGQTTRAGFFLTMARRLDSQDALAARLSGLTPRRLRTWRRQASAGNREAALRLAAAHLVLGQARPCLRWAKALLGLGNDARAALLAGWARLLLGQPGQARVLIERALGGSSGLERRALVGLLIAKLPAGLGKWLALLTSAAL